MYSPYRAAGVKGAWVLVLVRQLSLGPKGRPELSSHLPWRSSAVDARHLQSSGWRSSYASWEPALRHAMQASQELAAVGDPGPRADATDVEPDAQPARRDHRRVRRQVDILGDCRPREPVHAAARRHGGPPGAEGPARCPRSPVGCFAIPRRHQPARGARPAAPHPPRTSNGSSASRPPGPPPSCRPSGPR